MAGASRRLLPRRLAVSGKPTFLGRQARRLSLAVLRYRRARKCANLVSLMPTHGLSSDELELLAANEAFYAAFRERDVLAMDALWASGHPVACTHPGWEALHGRDDVLASWHAIMDNPEAPQVLCVEAVASLLGEAAFVTCIEQLGNIELVATNVFVRELGLWKLVHHQAGPFVRNDDEEPTDISQLN